MEDKPHGFKSFQAQLKRRYEDGDPDVGLLGESSGKFDYYVLYPKKKPVTTPPPTCKPLLPHPKPPPPASPPCMVSCPKPQSPSPKPSPNHPKPASKPPLMPFYKKALSHLRCSQSVSPKPNPISSSPMVCAYEPTSDPPFPATDDFDHPAERTRYVWRSKDPSGLQTDGTSKRGSAAEAALNWQDENAAQQNRALQKILHNQQQLAAIVQKQSPVIPMLEARIAVVEKELYVIATTVRDSNLLLQKEMERKNLKAQLYSLKNPPHPAFSLFDDNPLLPRQNPLPAQPPPFMPSSVPIVPWASPPPSYSQPLPPPPQPSASQSFSPTPPSQPASHPSLNPIASFLRSRALIPSSDDESSEASSQTESTESTVPDQLMQQPTPQPPQADPHVDEAASDVDEDRPAPPHHAPRVVAPESDHKKLFTLDDLSPHEWQQ
ncbi:vegetative cell wall protein gp1-like [Magnolia sinica]|uniref:vegetative cell wall protein gp1-like n=1 Tax=Magnolia sinica TaxID=86752 RepID=UPI00265B3942|nr:vegetative cell wall protein gp1-like [Magnolia sinica]